jgi:hypothetical protein
VTQAPFWQTTFPAGCGNEQGAFSPNNGDAAPGADEIVTLLNWLAGFTGATGIIAILAGTYSTVIGGGYGNTAALPDPTIQTPY